MLDGLKQIASIRRSLDGVALLYWMVCRVNLLHIAVDVRVTLQSAVFLSVEVAYVRY